MRGTFDWGVLDEKRTHPNTNIEGPKWDFNPPSVIMCHNRVGAVAYVGKVCLLKSKAAECTKEDPCKILAIGANSRPLRAGHVPGRVPTEILHDNQGSIHGSGVMCEVNTVEIC